MAHVFIDDLCEGTKVLYLNDPFRGNALTQRMANEFSEAVRLLLKNKPRVLVLSGSGKVFSTIGDGQFHLTITKVHDPLSRNLALRSFLSSFLLLSKLKVPIIAAINGDALGPGFFLACACDYRVASRDAILGCDTLVGGRYPMLGATLTIPRLVGPSNALEIFSGQPLSASQAHRIGLVERLAAPGDLLEETKKMALVFAQGSPLSTENLLARLRPDEAEFAAALRHETENFNHASSPPSLIEIDQAMERPVKLYLLRHGAALRQVSLSQSDQDRPLKPQGIRDLRASLETLKRNGVSCRKVLSSPYQRARETAQLASLSMGSPAVETLNWLKPHGSFEEYPWTGLTEDTLVVGHEPDLSELCSYLVMGQRRPRRDPLFTLNKGGAACLELSSGQSYKLLWLFNPRDSRSGSPVIS